MEYEAGQRSKNCEKEFGVHKYGRILITRISNTQIKFIYSRSMLSSWKISFFHNQLDKFNIAFHLFPLICVHLLRILRWFQGQGGYWNFWWRELDLFLYPVLLVNSYNTPRLQQVSQNNMLTGTEYSRRRVSLCANISSQDFTIMVLV